MNWRRKFSPGDWIDAPKGIGQVQEVNPVYCEENDYRVANEEKKLGNLDNIIVIYKLFCDHDYSVQTTERWNCATNGLCHRIDKKYRSKIDALISQFPSEYEAYKNDSDNSWLGQTWLFDGLIRPDLRSTYISKCEAIAKELGENFRLSEFKQCLYSHSMPVPIVPDPEIGFDNKGNLRLTIFNHLFRSENKRAIYTKFGYDIVDKYIVTRR